MHFSRRILKPLLALLLLDQLLAMTNWWPTPAVRPDLRLAPEFVLLWVALLLAVRIRGALSARGIAVFSIGYLLLSMGRYFDTAAPALFGRPINLYWDGQQALRFLWVSAQNQPLLAAALVAGGALVLLALYRLTHWGVSVSAHEAAPYALRSRPALALTALAVVLAVANVAGVRATWPFMSRPVLPTYARQAMLLWTALSPERLAQALPASPPFDFDLAALRGIDVRVVFIESYGATAYEHPDAARVLGTSRERLAQAIRANGRHVVSGLVRSPTFGGASDLAHLGLLSGLDLTDPRRHDLLVTTTRPTLLSLFRQRGYETFGLYPALSWDWPERRFYGFDRFIDARDLGYRGPRLGYWWIPDQYTIARFEQLHPVTAASPPRLLFFPSITSHFPFSPVPPYQPDWQRVLGDEPFDATDVARALAATPQWFNMLPSYLQMIDYEYRWLAGWLQQPSARDFVMVVLGDHQPTSNVSGDGAPWDVPVHVIASDAALLQRFVALGFQPGLQPSRPALGAMHEFTRMLLRAFSSDGGA